MTIKLNVLITLSDTCKTFSVWSDNRPDCPEIDIYEGHGFSLSAAIDNYYENLPNNIIIDDDVTVQTTEIQYTLKRPFKISKSHSVQSFLLT